MDFSLLFSISRKHILSRFKQSSIAALGVTFGIGTFIILVSFMTGLNGLLDGLILNRTPHVRIYNEIERSQKQPIEYIPNTTGEVFDIQSIRPKQIQNKIYNALPILNSIKNDPTVLGATAQMATQAFYTSGTIELTGVINGVDILEEVRLFNMNDYIVSGEPEDLATNRNGIIIGAGIADKLNLEIGDNLQVVSVTGDRFTLKVEGIYQSGLAEIDKVNSYVNLATAQKISGKPSDYMTDINVKLHQMENAKIYADNYKKKYNVNAIDIKTANAQFETGTSIRNMITYAVSITLLIVAGFGIYNILNMLIYEKMNDIAMLKAIGFSGRDVQIIFISQAVMIGIIGGVLGLIIGYGVSVVIDNLPFETEALPTIKTFPVNFDAKFYVIGIVFAMVSTYLAGYLPSRKAKKIDPVAVLRGQ